MNTRTAAQLFKIEVEGYFNRWEEGKPLRTGYPHASAILAPESAYCLRSLVLAATHPEEVERQSEQPWSAKTNQVFLNGWCLHEKYQRLLQDYGNVVEVEKSHFDEDRLLHFTPDAIVEFLGEQMVVEIKGYKQENFDKLHEEGKPPTDAANQCNLYMHLLKLKHGLILVENKNTQALKAWCLEYDRDRVQSYLDRIYHFRTALHKAQRGESLPMRTCFTQHESKAAKCNMCSCCFKSNSI